MLVAVQKTPIAVSARPASTDAWITKPEAAELLQCSEKSIERYASQGKLRQAWRRVPGRRPLAVYCPEDIETLRGQTVQAAPVAI